MGKHDKYRSSSRSPARQSRRESDSDDDYKRRERRHGGDGSEDDDAYKERKRREKEEKRRRKEQERYGGDDSSQQRERGGPTGGYAAQEYGVPQPQQQYGQHPDTSRQHGDQRARGSNDPQASYGRTGSSGYQAPAPYAPPAPYQPPAAAEYGQQPGAGGYGQHQHGQYQPPPPPSQQSGALQGSQYGQSPVSPSYGQPPAQYDGGSQSRYGAPQGGQQQHGGYESPGHTQSYPPPPPTQLPYAASQAQGHHQGGQQQHGGYESPGHTQGYPPPPSTQLPYAASQAQGHHQGYGGPPPPSAGGYQSDRPLQSPTESVHHGGHAPPSAGGYQSDRPLQLPTESVHHGGLQGFTARPEYGQSSGHAAYRPHQHSTAQESIPSEKPYFSGDVVQETKPAKTSPLASFTTSLNASLHDYARNLFPATSTYSQQAAQAGENTTHADHGARTGHRFDSFARTRTGNGAKWYVDGHDYMYAVSVALERARHTIYIMDWWLSPELYLRRPPTFNEQYRLDRMLQAAAARGVQVRIMVYKEVTQALTLDSHHTKHHLEDLHPNIVVIRHPDHLPDRDNVIRNTFSKIKSGTYSIGDGLKGLYGMKDDITLYFAHHEKLCLIDHEIAFMGGLDLCFGRYDTNEHPIADAHPSDLRSIVFPGQDYNNARFQDFKHVDKFEENDVSRLEISRMGWSDVAMSLMGPTVQDLRQHFVERWNFIYYDKYDARGLEKHKPLDASFFDGGHGFHRQQLKEKVKDKLRDPQQPSYYENRDEYERRDTGPEGVRLQICRSSAKWSHGTDNTEHSVANAYIEIISAAKHFVYMENQFFITATDPKQKPILNMVGRAIVDRIIRAARANERFRIVVCIPAVPGFAGDLEGDDALGTRAIMEFQYRAINNDRGMSIMEQIAKAGIDPKQYIRFYNLRSYDRINTAGVADQQAAAGVSYTDAQRVHDAKVGGGYAGQEHGDQYARYQQQAPKVGGEWDSVAKCAMLGGGDIRNVPWGGDPDKEIEAFVSEELYIHSKLLIADDRIVIMGSANLNDRSQLGDHDSEIVCVIEDPTPLPSRMNSHPYTASHFAGTLRRQIFRKHLGLIPAQNLSETNENMQPIPVPNIYDFDSAEDRLVEDPLSDEFWHFWNSTAKINTDAFARVFHAVPHDSCTNWKKYRDYWSTHFAAPVDAKNPKKIVGPAKEMWGHVVRSEFSPGAQGAREVKEVLASVRGHLVEMPLDFLKEEDIAKEGLGLNFATETLYT